MTAGTARRTAGAQRALASLHDATGVQAGLTVARRRDYTALDPAEEGA
jgi:hypothetical protein